MPFEINKTELVWPGKYDADGNLVQPPRVSLPFQVIERVNETRATREAKKTEGLTLFDVWDGANEGATFEDGWRNKLIWGENSLIMSSLTQQLSGRVNLIYVDPPFDVGADFSLKIQIGDSDIRKSPTPIEEVAYRDTWGKGSSSYISMIFDRLTLMRELLCESGVAVIHVGIQVSHFLRMAAEEIFGTENVVDEIVWNYGGASGGRAAGNKLVKVHEYLIVCAKDRSNFTYNKQFLPYSEKYIEERFTNVDGSGRRFRTRGRGGGVYEKQYLDESPGVPLSTVWSDIRQTYAMHLVLRAKEETGYPTQKPEALLDRVIRAFSNEGDLVVDVFSGSGTTLAVAEKLGRRWIGADLGRFSIHTTRKRLLEIDKCKPFEVLNLGSYERQFWSTANFGKDLDGDGKINLLEYIAFILRLYGAEPLTGSSHLHGRKGDSYIYVGAVSNPVTIAEIEQAVNECKAMKGSTVHVLGWEWEMGLHDPIVGEAKRLGVKLVLRQIPREVMEAEAVRKGQIKFFELAYLEVVLEQKSNGEVVCTLNDFSTPNTDFVPEEVREKIKKWSDYVDYWAVDWDFQNDTFNHGFVTYRTRQDRTLQLKSDPHKYSNAGTYKVMIKAIDIFGNDTSKLVEFKVK